MNVVYYRMMNAAGYSGYIPVNANAAAAAAAGGGGSYSPLPGATPPAAPTPGTGLGGALAPTAAPGGGLMPKLVFPSFSATQIQYMFRPKLGRVSKVNKSVRCETCGISLNSEQQAQQHYSGKNHLKKLKQAQGEKTGKSGKRKDKDKEKSEGDDKDDDSKSKDDDEEKSQRSSTSRSSSPSTTVTHETDTPEQDTPGDGDTPGEQDTQTDSEEEGGGKKKKDKSPEEAACSGDEGQNAEAFEPMDDVDQPEEGGEDEVKVADAASPRDECTPSPGTSVKRGIEEVAENDEDADRQPGSPRKRVKSESHDESAAAEAAEDEEMGEDNKGHTDESSDNQSASSSTPPTVDAVDTTTTDSSSSISESSPVSATPKTEAAVITTSSSTNVSITTSSVLPSRVTPVSASPRSTNEIRTGPSKPLMSIASHSRSSLLNNRTSSLSSASSLATQRPAFLTSPAAALQGTPLHGTALAGSALSGASLQGRQGFLAYLPPGSGQFGTDQTLPSQNSLLPACSTAGRTRVSLPFTNTMQSPALPSGTPYTFPFTYPNTPSDLASIPRVIGPVYSPSMISASPMTSMLAGQAQLANIPMATSDGRAEDTLASSGMLNSYQRVGLVNQTVMNGLGGVGNAASFVNQSLNSLNSAGVINQSGLTGSSVSNYQDLSYQSYGASVEALSIETVTQGAQGRGQYQLPSPYNMTNAAGKAVSAQASLQAATVSQAIPASAQTGHDAGDIGPKMDPVTRAVYDNMLGKLPTKRKVDIPCDVCDLVFNSEVQANAHFKGIKHAKRVKLQEEAKDKSVNGKTSARLGSVTPPQRSSPTTPGSSSSREISVWGEVPGHQSGWFHCSTCDISVSTAAHLQTHISGTAHQAKKAESQKQTLLTGLTRLPS